MREGGIEIPAAGPRLIHSDGASASQTYLGRPLYS